MSTVAYVSNADSGSVTVLSLDTTDGGLHPVQELAVGGQLMPLALAADGRCLYAARRSLPLALLRFMIEPAQGRLGAPAETALPASMPSIALDATGRWLLAASYDEGIVAVCAVGPDAQAMPAHQVLSSGPKTHRILTTPDNRWALACVLGRDQLLRYCRSPRCCECQAAVGPATWRCTQAAIGPGCWASLTAASPRWGLMPMARVCWA
jgi:6-phosphogluconolactonase